jgi:RNA-directed DNA polymerase
VKAGLWRRMHEPLPDQGQWLARVVRGYFAYHAVPTNARSLNAFHHQVGRLWLRTLKRCGQRDASTWARIAQLVADCLALPRILHPWPDVRFVVTHPRWEPSA